MTAACYVAGMWLGGRLVEWLRGCELLRLGIIGSLLVVGCATLAIGTPSTQTVAYLDMGNSDIQGMTICSETNQPVIILNERLTGRQSAIDEVMLHENVHVHQAVKHEGGCKGLMKEFRSSAQARFDIEFSAYCTSARSAVIAHKIKKSTAIEYLTTFMRLMYPTKQTEEQVRMRAEFCLGDIDEGNVPRFMWWA